MSKKNDNLNRNIALADAKLAAVKLIRIAKEQATTGHWVLVYQRPVSKRKHALTVSDKQHASSGISRDCTKIKQAVLNDSESQNVRRTRNFD